jgi:hypothetical protein
MAVYAFVGTRSLGIKRLFKSSPAANHVAIVSLVVIAEFLGLENLLSKVWELVVKAST